MRHRVRVRRVVIGRWSRAALFAALGWGLASWLVLPRWWFAQPSVLVWHQVVPVVIAAGLTIGLLVRSLGARP